MRISVQGALVGAGIGAVGRGLVVFCFLGPAIIIALPSAGIGLLVGAISGALGKPLYGALLGFVLSAFVFELFICACASALGSIGELVGDSHADTAFLTRMLPYMLLMGVAGAAAGAIGGFVGKSSLQNEQLKLVSPTEKLPQAETATDDSLNLGSSDHPGS